MYWKNERIAHFRSFLHFWWAMWVNRSCRSNQMSNVSKSLRSLTKNEWPWVIPSGCLEEMSDRERMPQVAHQRIYFSDRRDSTRHRLTKMWLTQPLPPHALWDEQVVQYTADRAGRGWVSLIFGRRWWVLSLLSLKYILWCTPSSETVQHRVAFGMDSIRFSLDEQKVSDSVSSFPETIASIPHSESSQWWLHIREKKCHEIIDPFSYKINSFGPQLNVTLITQAIVPKWCTRLKSLFEIILLAWICAVQCALSFNINF